MKAMDTHLTAKGFFMLEFDSSKEWMEMVLCGPWFMVSVGLFMLLWNPSFNPQIEMFSLVPLWVWLSNLSLEFQNPNSLEAIGDVLGDNININKATKVKYTTTFDFLCIYTYL